MMGPVPFVHTPTLFISTVSENNHSANVGVPSDATMKSVSLSCFYVLLFQ